MSKRAVILAGGRGTRLRPYTIAMPKPLVPIGDKPILEIILTQLAKSGFDHVTITLNHFADYIKAYFEDGHKWGIEIDYSFEEKPLSTMGPLKLINDLPENFLVMNGDVLTDLDFSAFFDFHQQQDNLFTISAFKRTQKIDYGLLQAENGFLHGFQEKPIMHHLVSMGVYMANLQVLDFIPADTVFGFDNLMMELLAKDKPISVREHDGYWLDIGRPEDYEKACDDYAKLQG